MPRTIALANKRGRAALFTETAGKNKIYLYEETTGLVEAININLGTYLGVDIVEIVSDDSYPFTELLERIRQKRAR